jgi:transcriptional regulator with XRE-family HTH domain
MISILGDKEALTQLGLRIRAARLRRNFTQEHVAKICGITLPTYRKIEAGDGKVLVENVARTIAILGFADRLADLVPEEVAPLTMQEVLKPERKRAFAPRRRR